MIRRMTRFLTPRGWRWLGYAAMAAIGFALYGALRLGIV